MQQSSFARPHIDKDSLRQALGRFSTGVTIVTTNCDTKHPRGLTVNSFASVSLDPPLIMWCLDQRSSQFDAFEAAQGFVVNILSADQESLCQLFASNGRNDVSAEAFSKQGKYGPVIANSIAAFECRFEHRYNAGDHRINVGRVEEMSTQYGDPLIFFGGKFRMLANN